MAMTDAGRVEQEIFDDLAALCASPGYAHVIAFFCFRDNIIGYEDELKGEDYAKLFSPKRLIRTEISTLIGLMARTSLDLQLPVPEQLSSLVERTEARLKEMHEAMMRPFTREFQAALADGKSNPFTNPGAMREPIFYGPESAYSFQYRDFAEKKYSRDDAWLRENKGFGIDDATNVVRAIWNVQERKLLATLRGLRNAPPEAWSILDGFILSSLAMAILHSRLCMNSTRPMLFLF
jgi:hypothetical protein